ncbi:hypothetical protein B0H14DRAFT_3753377 [Mycena olivaceomarginata]|nr:hypothetical protein B0H14DRAFT_3753377 [Mycena olivaceomarginata]
MPSYTDNTWDGLRTMSPLPDEHNPAFNTTGWSNAEINVASHPRSTAPTLTFPTDDFSTFNFDTPRPGKAPSGAPLTPVTPVSDEFPASPFEPFHFTTAHLQSANKQFDDANTRADAIFAMYNRARPLFDAPVNLPRGPLPSNQVRTPVRVNDNIRKAIGQSGAAGKKRSRDKVEKENGDGDGDGNGDEGSAAVVGGKKAKFTAEHLILLCRIVIDLQPWLAPYKLKGATWQLVVKMMIERGFPHPSITPATMQNKAEALVAFKKDPSKNVKLANLIGEGTSAGITIGALLERLETQYDQAKDKSDEAKEQIKKKNDENRQGGDAIRDASMKTLRSRRRANAVSDDEGEITDTEPTATPSRATAASSSIEVLNSDDDAAAKTNKSKRRRRNESYDKDGLLSLMKAENERRAKHDEHIAQTFNKFVDKSVQQKDEYITLLKSLITPDRVDA